MEALWSSRQRFRPANIMFAIAVPMLPARLTLACCLEVELCNVVISIDMNDNAVLGLNDGHLHPSHLPRNCTDS
jgi:hypothetical protein